MSEKFLRYLLEAVFYLLIPLSALFFRYKKKLTTGFAAGLVLSSFALGIISVATVARGNPVASFMKEINLKNYDKAKRAYKIIVQYGNGYLNKINEADIIDPLFFKKIKEDTAAEYIKIAHDIYNSVSPDDSSNREEEANKLKHALKLLSMAESTGYADEDLKTNLKAKIEKKLLECK